MICLYDAFCLLPTHHILCLMLLPEKYYLLLHLLFENFIEPQR